MERDKWGLYGLIIAMIELDVNIFVYIKTKSFTNVIIIIAASLFFILIVIISDALSKIKEDSEKIDKITEKLKRAEDLIDIRADINYLKRKAE